MKQYITTQLVEAEEMEHGPFKVVFPSLGFGAVVLPEMFNAECYPIDRLEVGFGLAMEGMKHGLWFRRKAWPSRADEIGLKNGLLYYRTTEANKSDAMHFPAATLRADDLVAEDWVVAP